ncbi:MAG: hypothetical protein ACI9LU_001579 [Polaribacter sp.]|jgi:hypothetical protein
MSKLQNISVVRSTPFLLLLVAVSFTGCTWVKNSPEASSVRVVPMDRVADCKNVGNVSTNTVDNISVVNRNAAKVERELETLAQNEAAQSGADTIVATTKVVDGRRTFAMYKCL